MKIVYWGIIMLLCLCGCTVDTGYAGLQDILSEYCKDKDAKIGIGVIIDGKDTVAVKGDKPFPMLSVYKFRLHWLSVSIVERIIYQWIIQWQLSGKIFILTRLVR